jgi:hypothetical protein
LIGKAEKNGRMSMFCGSIELTELFCGVAAYCLYIETAFWGAIDNLHTDKVDTRNQTVCQSRDSAKLNTSSMDNISKGPSLNASPSSLLGLVRTAVPMM